MSRYPDREPDDYRLTVYWRRRVPFVRTYREWRGDREWILAHILTRDELEALGRGLDGYRYYTGA